MHVISVPKDLIQSNHFTNLKERKVLPSELLAEIIKFLPLDIKWTNLRISVVFYFFVLKTQRRWIFHFKRIVDPVRQLLQLSKDKLISLHAFFDKQGTTETSLWEIYYTLSIFWNVCSNIAWNVVRADHDKLLDQKPSIWKEEGYDTIDYKKKRASKMFVINESLINILLGLDQIKFAKLFFVDLLLLKDYFHKVSKRCTELHAD
ncbi:hypothetical protein ACQ4LE_000742 [Meloidogyne hapla]